MDCAMLKHLNLVIIEDNEDICEFLQDFFSNYFKSVICFKDGTCNLSIFNDIHIVILDIMLPFEDGFSLCSRIKLQNPELPIIFLTAKNNIDDKIKGITMADDYLVKPFDPLELLARVNSIANKKYHSIIEIKHLLFNMQTKRLHNKLNNEEIFLTDKQLNLFLYFIHNKNINLSKEQIMSYLWENYSTYGNLSVHIKHLRDKIEFDPQKPTIIETIYGYGYRLNY
ncbi:response regulator transcription factor [Lysinibacillus xylanilyticus]|uniref:Response regulator transcription factor n=1 Tax=Lysinibacillus xylanilyticus TaxID=582475 RepID=A0ABT4EXR7_9BACI|nr:response regulator transcription factor [Lysinibacillus xylanilyticus]MCY9549276.1 response regulator transcription factor [Lysinibacillus xylanilyticus]